MSRTVAARGCPDSKESQVDHAGANASDASGFRVIHGYMMYWAARPAESWGRFGWRVSGVPATETATISHDVSGDCPCHSDDERTYRSRHGLLRLKCRARLIQLRESLTRSALARVRAQGVNVAACVHICPSTSDIRSVNTMY